MAARSSATWCCSRLIDGRLARGRAGRYDRGMSRFQKLVTSFFAIMVLSGLVLQMVSLFAAPAVPPADQTQNPRQP